MINQVYLPLSLNKPISPDNPSLMKHPVGRHACSDVLIHPPVWCSVFHPVIFDALNGAAIHSAAFWTKGAAGPSGLDAYGWRCLCTSFQAAPDDMCDGLALVASFVDPAGITALVASQLIALDKYPGVYPIVLDEVIR